MSAWTMHRGDCLDWLATLPDKSVDAVVSDPPYPEISRDYGRLTEGEWHTLMRGVVEQSRRVLKPHGSAVFILHPNSERVGRMRPWLWEFMAWTAREWNMVQDAWWWNTTAPPTVHTHRDIGLMRPSLKACVWLGEPDCFRDQDAVLWTESEANAAARAEGRFTLDRLPSGQSMRRGRCAVAAQERGGVTPFNVLPIPNANSVDSGGAHGHGAATPYPLCAWWVRYLSKPGDLVLDPFAGSGTTGAACLRLGRRFAGSENDATHYQTACDRLAAEAGGSTLAASRAGQLSLLADPSDTKNRFDLPDTLPLSWEDFESACKAHVPADPAKLRAEIEGLLPQLDEETRGKAVDYLSKHGADPAKLAQLADRVRSKVVLQGSEGGES